ncbi:MAG: hypothetical protein N3H31_04585 [Candidatus Nezhaarchaeota archaeon]|nr:hypothetical protein [Candidatus Nezhaarchaeota archaeon]
MQARSMSLEELLEKRLQRLIATALGLSLSDLRLVDANERLAGPVGGLVDYLGHFEASVAAALLSRRGLKAGVDYAIFPEGPGGRFALVLRKDVEAEAIAIVDKLRELRYAKPVALKILKEWRAAHGEAEEDVDEAIHLALRVSRVKDRLLSRECPRCGGMVAKVSEKASPSQFKLTIERTCCGYVERATIPLKRCAQ